MKVVWRRAIHTIHHVRMNRGAGTRIRLAAIAGSVLGIGLLSAALWQGAILSRHNTIQQLQNIPVNSAVRLVGVVTYADQPDSKVWIQDETGAIPLSINPQAAGVHVGETVVVSAIKTSHYDPLQGPVSVGLSHVRIHSTTAHVRLPQPYPVALASFPASEKNGIRIQISAIVRSAKKDPYGRARLSIGDAGREIDLFVAHPERDDSTLIDSRIRVTGVPEQIRTPAGAPLHNRMWVASSRDIQVEQPAPQQTRLFSVRSLYLGNRKLDGHRIRMRGTIVAVSPASLLLEDHWGEIVCRLDSPASLKIGSSVEVEGFPTRQGVSIDLFHARATPIPRQELPVADGNGATLRTLTTVAAVRALSAADAAQALPVRITSTITYVDPPRRHLFIQEKSGGIFVKYSGDHPELQVGRHVTVVGITNPGDFAPVIVAPQFRISGSAPLPVPVPATPEAAAAGSLDSQYVSMDGVVHAFTVGEEPGHPTLTFELLAPLGQVHVYTSPFFPDLDQVRDLEDAKVRIRGVLGTVFNSRRQLVGYQLLIESRSAIEVIEPAAPHPFSMAATPIGSLLRYSPDARFGHRVKVEGTVTLVESGFLYLQDASDGVEIRGDTRSIRVGEKVEALGYPTLVGRYSPIMTDAVFRSTGQTGSVPPRILSAESIHQGLEDSLLVSVEGTVLMTLDSPERKSLVLQSGIRTFTAQLDSTDEGPPEEIRDGTVLRLTGVCSTQLDRGRLYRILEEDPDSFQILLRSPRDLAVIRPAPFWTLHTTLALLGVSSLLMLAILVWVSLLRRRVRLQMAALQKASETAQAIKDLSIAMQNLSREERFDTQVSVRGSEEIAQLVIGFNRVLTELRLRDRARREAEARLQNISLMDNLTGLPNRRLLSDRLSQNIAKARRENQMVALLYIDLDGFKLVNDSLGHSIGDVLLGRVAQRLKGRFRQSDTVARIGADEFALVLDQMQNQEDVQKTAENLLDVLNLPFQIEGQSVRIGASIGISIFPGNAQEADQLLQQADCAMYAAKRNGKNRVVRYGDDLGNAARERLTLEGELRRAIAEGQISVHYQPEFDLATDCIVRFEALARWTHPRLGNIPPVSFIPVAEESGLIVPLGAYIMERACREALLWQKMANHSIQVAVNVSSVQFARESFLEEVQSILRRTGLQPSLLQLELTESATLTGIERAADTMRRLKALGVSVAMDDFGTGYSCLSYLPRLSFDALKIDRSFVNELMVRPEIRAFVQSILTLAHNLNMRVIVEGIETREQLELVKALGSDEAQGYLLGRPSANPAEQLRHPWHASDNPQSDPAHNLEVVS